jgi:conjugal transfer/entry exclusion protein
MRRGWGIALLLVAFWAPRLSAQGLPVIDVLNLGQNTVQALQSVLMVANMVLELTPLGEIVLGDEFSADLESLGAVVEEARGLSYDLASLNSQITTLFDLNTAPRGSLELQQRLAAIRKVVFDSYVYALRTQTLIKTALSAVRHLTRLIAAVGDLAGNMQSNQTLIQLEGKLNQSLATLQVQTAAYERAQSVERLTDVLTRESAQRIDEAIMADWPK